MRSNIPSFLMLICMSAVALISTSVFALGSNEYLKDPMLEARANQLFKEIRCVVCAGESIHDSGALIAHDMRALIREQIRSGKSNADIKAFLVERYSESILMTPPLSGRTAILWFAPFILLGVGLLITYIFLRRTSRKRRIV